MAGTPQRRPGDGNDFGFQRSDPNANFLGEQSLSQVPGGFVPSLRRLVRALLKRRGGGRRR